MLRHTMKLERESWPMKGLHGCGVLKTYMIKPLNRAWARKRHFRADGSGCSHKQGRLEIRTLVRGCLKFSELCSVLSTVLTLLNGSNTFTCDELSRFGARTPSRSPRVNAEAFALCSEKFMQYNCICAS